MITFINPKTKYLPTMKTFKDYARSFAENLDVRRSYRWAAGAFAGLTLGLGLVVGAYREDPFVNLDPNSPVAPIVRDVFESGEKTECGRMKKDYFIPPEIFVDECGVQVEIWLDAYDHPARDIRVTTSSSYPISDSLRRFTDWNGDGESDIGDKGYERIVTAIKENIKYGKMAKAVASYVERNGKYPTQWKPFFPRTPSLSFLGWNVPMYESQRHPIELNCTLEQGSNAKLLIYNYDALRGYPPDFVMHKVWPNLTIHTSDGCVGWDNESTGYEEFKEVAGVNIPIYRKTLEKVANSFGINVDD